MVSRGRRVNMTSCEELVASIDPECAFDQKAVQDFTAAVQANGGDWTIAFWIRPTGDESKIQELGNFYPHVQFLGSISPPQHNLVCDHDLCRAHTDGRVVDCGL
eukprot:3935833-Rhodomonas_salina.5